MTDSKDEYKSTLIDIPQIENAAMMAYSIVNVREYFTNSIGGWKPPILPNDLVKFVPCSLIIKSADTGNLGLKGRMQFISTNDNSVLFEYIWQIADPVKR